MLPDVIHTKRNNFEIITKLTDGCKKRKKKEKEIKND